MGIFWTSVVAKMNLTCGGGSSSVLSRALKAAFDSMWTSSMIYILYRARVVWVPMLLRKTGVVHAVVAGAVDLDDVHVVAGRDAAADFAFVAGSGRRPLFAVEGLGEDASGGGLADAAGAGEQVSVSDAVALKGVYEGAGGGFLADQVREGLRSITTGQDGVGFVGRR